MHQNLHTLGVGVFVKHFNVEVGIRGYEVEDVALPHIGPVFPTYVPTLNEHFVETIFGSKVDITLYLFVVSGMTAVRLHTAPIYLVELDRGEIVGIVPGALANNHFPPYTTVFRRVNP